MSFRKRRAAAVAVGALLVGVVGFATPAGATASVVTPGHSIQAAIDAASPGDTIIIRPGVYNENLDVTVDGITLIGIGATLEPPDEPEPNTCSQGDPATDGICVAGVADPDTGEVSEYRENVRIIGLHVDGFPGTGIIGFGASGMQIIGNTLTDNEEYGAAAFASTGTRAIGNHVSGAEEAGLYFGDSPDANARAIGNILTDNGFGIFQRNAENVLMTGNKVTANCLGILVLADAPGPAGSSLITGNFVKDNTKVCPASEESPSPIAGLGIALAGAHDVTVRANVVTGNVLADPDSPSGGIIVLTGDGGTEPTDNTVTANYAVGNETDIVWDGAGTGNVFTHNLCQTSDPDGLC